jgi:iron complex outermembrane receptor protein
MKIRNLPKASRSMIGLLALASMPVMAASDTEQAATDEKKAAAKDAAAVLPEVSVSGQSEKAEPTLVEKYKLPVTVESITKEKLDDKVNVFNTEDAIKYMPSILVRKRYVGDTNAPLATRTTGTSSSARTLIYADGVLLSSLLANNNGNTGSPRWNTVTPNEIERVDMLYGPFSAAYSGNSMGGVLNITTKMPEKFEAHASAQASWQDYSMYGNSGTYETQNYSAGIGDKHNDLSFRFDFNHLDSASHPVSYATSTLSTTNAGPSDVAVAGAYQTLNQNGQGMMVLGGSQIVHTVQDNFKWKLAYDISPTVKASYTLGMWQNNADWTADSFLRNAAGNQVSTGNVNIGGKQYKLSTGPTFTGSTVDQTTWSHGMNLKSNTGGKFDWELVGSVVDLGNDITRAPTVDPSLAAAGGAGKLTSQNGTNWHTADAKGIWRPGDYFGNHEVSFGFHHDLYELVNPVYVTSNWMSGDPTSNLSNSAGKTQTEGYWLQDSWDFYKKWNFTAGGRLENWNAYDGVNSSIVSGSYKTLNQANLHSVNFSPKGKLTWSPNEELKFGAAIGKAYRYPTAGELFQTTAVGTGASATLINGNPNLKPEDVLSSELSGEYFFKNGRIRLSLFQENVKNAIYATQSLVDVPGGTAIKTSITNNIGQTDTYGIELSGDANDVGINGLDIFASGTWTDSKITDNAYSDSLLAAGVAKSTGKDTPRIPQWRANFGVSYRATDKLIGSVNGRYSGMQYGSLNNTDIVHNTYFGTASFFVVDTRIKYQLTKQLSLSGGIDNINNNKYFIFHPFPQRTYMAELKFNY